MLPPAPNAGHLPLQEVPIAEALREVGDATLFAVRRLLDGGR
jgi:hypothetical protein